MHCSIIIITADCGLFLLEKALLDFPASLSRCPVKRKSVGVWTQSHDLHTESWAVSTEQKEIHARIIRRAAPERLLRFWYGKWAAGYWPSFGGELWLLIMSRVYFKSLRARSQVLSMHHLTLRPFWGKLPHINARSLVLVTQQQSAVETHRIRKFTFCEKQNFKSLNWRYSQPWLKRVLSCVIWRHIVLYEFEDVSEEPTASLFKVDEWTVREKTVSDRGKRGQGLKENI
jgi:hypothetical protein